MIKLHSRRLHSVLGFTMAAIASAALMAPAQASPSDELMTQHAPGANLIASAVSKLTREELSALLSTPLAVSQAGLDDVDTSGGPSINDVLRRYQMLMEKMKGPLKFMAADGSTFDCYGDYVEYQWGGYGLPCY